MKNKTNTKQTVSSVVSSFGTRLALGRTALALRSALPVGLMGRGLVKVVNPAKAPDSAFDFVGITTAPPRPGLRSGVATGWTKKPTLVGRRHRCLSPVCGRIVPVIQEDSSYCTLKCERTHTTIKALADAGFGRISR